MQGTISVGDAETVVAVIVRVVMSGKAVVVIVRVVVSGKAVVVVVDAKNPIVVVGFPLQAAVQVDSELQCCGVMPHQPHFDRQCWSVLQGSPLQVP